MTSTQGKLLKLKTEIAHLENLEKYERFPNLYNFLKRENYNFDKDRAFKNINHEFAILLRFYSGCYVEALFQDRQHNNNEIYPPYFILSEGNYDFQEMDAIRMLTDFVLPIKYKMTFTVEREFYYASSDIQSVLESECEYVDYLKSRDFNINLQVFPPTTNIWGEIPNRVIIKTWKTT